MNRMKKMAGLTVLVALVLITGCDWASRDWSNWGKEYEPIQEPAPQEMLKEIPRQTQNMTVQRRPYRLRVSDEVEVIYHIKTAGEVGGNYRVKPRDIITIVFPNYPDYDLKEAEVPSDGKIQVMLIDEPIEVAGKTAREITNDLRKHYTKFFKVPPLLTVTVKESKKDISDLRETITTAPRGMSRLVPVTPDGTIALPLVGSVKVQGKTVEQVRKIVGDRYRKIRFFEDLDVTVNIETVAPLRVYVLGEVSRPGLILGKTGAKSGINELTVLQSIAQAGGYIRKDAEISRVLVIRKSEPQGSNVAMVNLERMLEKYDLRTDPRALATTGPRPTSALFNNDIWLKDGDIVFVPAKDIVKKSDWVKNVFTEYIYRILPFNFSTVLSFGGGSISIFGANP